MFAHRQLKRKSPNRQKIEELFAEISDEVLLGAIANPDHSDEARRILKELAERRGLQVGGGSLGSVRVLIERQAVWSAADLR